MTTTRDLIREHRDDIRLMKRSLLSAVGEINWRQVIMDLDTLEEQCESIERSIPQMVLVDTSRFVPAPLPTPLPVPLPDVPLAGAGQVADGSHVNRGGAPMGVSQSGGGYDHIESRQSAPPDPGIMNVSTTGGGYDRIDVRSTGGPTASATPYVAPARQGVGQNEMIVTSRNPQGPALPPGADPSLAPVPVNDPSGGTYMVRTRPNAAEDPHGTVTARPAPNPYEHGAVVRVRVGRRTDAGAVAVREGVLDVGGTVAVRPAAPAPVARTLPDGSTVMEVPTGDSADPMRVTSRPSVGPIKIDPRFAHYTPIGATPPAAPVAAPLELPFIPAVEAASAAEGLRRVTEGLAEVPVETPR